MEPCSQGCRNSGGTGAIDGAIIGKKKVKSAAIGAAGGYIIGRKKDKANTTR